MNEELFEDYFDEFGEYPPLYIDLSSDSKIYAKGIKEALKTHNPLTLDIIGELIDEESTERFNSNYDEKRIRDLLISYGASEEASEQFIEDLLKNKTQKEKERTKADIYKALREKGGSDLIIQLAGMSKAEREKAIKDYLKD